MSNTTTLHITNTKRKIGTLCEVSLNDEIQITAVKKLKITPSYEKNVSGFAAKQDENGVFIFHEL